jgi:hypothetical protein
VNRRASALAATLAALSVGCRTLERFDTEPGAAYCGALVGSPLVTDGFLVDGAPPRLEASLTLDTSQLGGSFGTLGTNDTDGLCAPRAEFERSALRAVAEVQQDQLYFLDFGEGRDQNVVAWVDSSCLGTLVAVVSLMRNDDVELRLLKPRPAASETTSAAERPGFALFQLQKQSAGCGF